MSVDTNDVVTVVVTTLLGGGIGTGVGALWSGRAVARKTTSEAKALDARVPAEVDSVVVQGAESAVLVMQKALESAQSRIVILEQERDRDRARIAELERKVEELRDKVSLAEDALGEARRAGQELRADLDDLIRSRTT